MVKPTVSYVKETNEVHYNPRFAIKFKPGNYYVEEANYFNEIRNSVYNNWRGNYITNIKNESYFNYIKILIVTNQPNYDEGLSLSIHESYFFVGDIMISYENGYCDYNMPV